MSERTTIGGTVYEAIGSSSSNLLLKCNGTARIQWGSKLIDLIKNGKIASGDSQELIFIIGDESEIKSDGIYVLTTEESDQLLVFKDGNKYNFTNTDLYISANKEQNLTVEQKKQALDNIGIYYDTLTEVQSAGIKNGIVYVTENKTLYTIKDGVIEEFEAKLKTVTVEKGSDNNREVINSDVKIVLSILDDEYLVLADQRITANYSIHVNNSAQIGSESADKTKGYRLYIDGDTSYLDVDEINVRNGLTSTQYQELSFYDFDSLIKESKLKAHNWYLISDFQNHWKLPIQNSKFNRPILVRALNENTLYEKGYLFSNHNIEIKYDPLYQEKIKQTKIENDGTSEEVITTRGRIVWMKDQFGNEANFDFLDYTDSNGVELTTLHFQDDFDTTDEILLQELKTNSVKSIFPKHSYNNKLIVHDLKGTVLKEQIIDNSNTTTVQFLFNDSENLSMEMHDNTIECREFILDTTCTKFYNNTLKQVVKLKITNDFINNTFESIYHHNTLSDINYFDLPSISEFTEIVFQKSIENVKCDNFKHSLINSSLKNVIFKNVIECSFNEGTIENVISYCDLNKIIFSENTHNLLYIAEKQKEVYLNNNLLQIICTPEQVFYRGMIIMHSGIEDIPFGWAICDGGEHTFNGITSKTPDLRNRFIKAVATVEEIKEVDNTSLNENGELVLTTDNLPKHSHPHYSHSHSFLGDNSDSFTVLTEASEGNVITSIEGGTEGKAITSVTSSTIAIYNEGTSSEYSTEKDWQYKEQPDPVRIEPNYYSLVFIMKL